MKKQDVELVGSFLFFLLVGSSMCMTTITPKAYAIRYWDTHVSKTVPPPEFFLNKASPLSASDSARFTQLAAQNSLSTHLDSFCKSARLFCLPEEDQQQIRHPDGPDFIPERRQFGTSYFTIWGTKDEKKSYKRMSNYKLVKRPDVMVEPPHFGTSYFRSWGTKNEKKIDKFATSLPPPGIFFREKMLKQGTVMPMPDIKDYLPSKYFLPRSILTKLPFSSSKITQLKNIFHASVNSSMEKIIKDALHDCERAPGPGEIKRCVGSIEDMIDFSVSVLGRSTEPRFTQNTNGSNNNILVGKAVGGKVTNAVSCHHTLYPYLLYYCHSLPNVRVYEADILDPDTKAKINHGVAVCHLDTSLWDPNHAAFRALGSGPGKVEVCHWIFENDLTWTA